MDAVFRARCYNYGESANRRSCSNRSNGSINSTNSAENTANKRVPVIPTTAPETTPERSAGVWHLRLKWPIISDNGSAIAVVRMGSKGECLEQYNFLAWDVWVNFLFFGGRGGRGGGLILGCAKGERCRPGWGWVWSWVLREYNVSPSTIVLNSLILHFNRWIGLGIGTLVMSSSVGICLLWQWLIRLRRGGIWKSWAVWVD